MPFLNFPVKVLMASNYYLVGYGLQPTPKMLLLLRKLIELNGIALEQQRIPKGFVVRSLMGQGDEHWFPTQVGRGLRNRGLIDEHGCITRAGYVALKLNGV